MVYEKDTVRLKDDTAKMPIREAALLEGIKLTMGDRTTAYGNPNINLTKMATMMRGYFQGRSTESFTSADMAAVMILAKLSRIAGNQTHHDSWVDAAVYAAIGLECAEQNAANDKQKGTF